MEPFRESQFYAYLQLGKEMDQYYHRLALSMGLSDGAMTVLYSLCEAERAPTPGEMAAEWTLSKQTIHSTLAVMERDGLISQRVDPDDRRRRVVALTAKGQALAERTVVPLIRAEQRAFARLTTQEAAALLDLSQKAAIYLKEETAEYL